jgi:hypothetical protein
VALVTVALASLTTACGGSSTKVSGPSTTTTTVAGRAAFVSCMEKQGIPASAATRFGGRPGGGGAPGGSVPNGSTPRTPSSLPAGVTQNQLRTALQACRGLLPRGAGFGGANRANSPAAAAYRNCLQLHGVTLPAPGTRTTTTTAPGSSTTGGAGNGGRGFGGLDTSNPTVRAALAACAALRPAPGGTTTTSTTATSS